MSTPKTKTLPDLTESSPKHQQAIIDGDSHFKSWQFNVIDSFKDKSTEEIKNILKSTANPFAVCMEHLINDFNFGTVIRNANCFNAREVFYVGNKKWDRRSSLGTYNYTDVNWLSSLEEFKKLQEKYTIVGIDNVPGSVSIENYQWKKDTLFVFGEEGVGLTPVMQSFCKDIVYIPQYGSCRSLNVGTASGIVMYDYIKKMRDT